VVLAWAGHGGDYGWGPDIFSEERCGGPMTRRRLLMVGSRVSKKRIAMRGLDRVRDVFVCLSFVNRVRSAFSAAARTSLCSSFPGSFLETDTQTRFVLVVLDPEFFPDSAYNHTVESRSFSFSKSTKAMITQYDVIANGMLQETMCCRWNAMLEVCCCTSNTRSAPLQFHASYSSQRIESDLPSTQTSDMPP
jgi:hypothetical protein